MPLAGGLKETLIRDLRALPPPTPRVTARMTAEFDALGHLSELLLSFEHEYEAIEQSVWHVQRVLSDTKVYPHAREGLVELHTGILATELGRTQLPQDHEGP